MVLAHNIDEGRRTQDVRISQDVTFDTMLLKPNTLQGLRDSGFYKPSPVQLHGIPLGKCGFDLLLEAKSGTGKTAVFSVIALEKLELDKGLQVVILAPTREIASQICDVIKQIGINYPGLIVEVVMGGLPVAEDIAKFKKDVHIVVGSPGRLRHLIQDKHMNLSSVRLLVLDEADKLMEKSFLADINYIFAILPKEKQIIMSSATYPEVTKTFINKYVNCAQHVCPDSNCILLGVEQKITVVKSNSNIVTQTQYRFKELLKILSNKQFKQCLIFCNYHARVKELYKLLNREKWPVQQLCSQQEQSDRLDALKTLQEYKCRILISTDLAARGIDASNVDLVINFEPPFEWQTYLHRIGRAGRYGSYGMAITILSENREEERFKNLLETINLDMEKVTHFWTSHKTVENIKDEPEICMPSLNNLVPTKTEVDYSKFWNTLTNDLVIEREIDNFEVLCKSFEEEKSQIESFTDLMNSYETNRDNDNNNSVYQNMSTDVLDQKLIKYFMKLINSDVSKYKLYTETNKKPDKENHENNIYNVETNNIKSKEVYKYVSNQEVKMFNEDDFIKIDSPDCNGFEELEKDSSRALLEAGLPLSFGGTNKTNIGKDSTASKKNKQSKCHLSNPKLYNKEKVKDNAYRESKYYRDKTNERLCKKIKERVHSQTSFANKDNGPCYSKREAIASNNNYGKDYINWYKQLKSRVKYIELVIYLDEMSRL